MITWNATSITLLSVSIILSFCTLFLAWVHHQCMKAIAQLEDLKIKLLLEKFVAEEKCSE